MCKGWIVGLLVCVLASSQIEGGGWQRLKLWKYRRDRNALEKKLENPSRLDETALLRCYEKARSLCSKVPDEQPRLLRTCSTCRERFWELIRERGKEEESDVQETIGRLERIAKNDFLLKQVGIIELNGFQREAIGIAGQLLYDPRQAELCERARACADVFLQELVDKNFYIEESTGEDLE